MALLTESAAIALRVVGDSIADVIKGDGIVGEIGRNGIVCKVVGDTIDVVVNGDVIIGDGITDELGEVDG